MRIVNPLIPSVDATPLPAAAARAFLAGAAPHKGNAKKPRGKDEQATEEQAAQAVSNLEAPQDEQHTSAEPTVWVDDVLLAQTDTKVEGDDGGASAAGTGNEQVPAVAGLSNTALLLGGVGLAAVAAATGGSSPAPAPAPAPAPTPAPTPAPAPAPAPAPDTTPPTFTAGATVDVDFAENGTDTVHTAAAIDNVGVAAYAFADGGADNDKFNLNTATGALTFKVAPDFEAPGSAAGSNAYAVKVKAVNAAGNNAVQTVTVTVTNVDESTDKTIPKAQTVDRDSVRYITGFSVADANSDAPVSVRLSVSHGTLLVAKASGVEQIRTGEGNNITLTGTRADVNAVLAAPEAVAYRGNLAYVGSDTLVMHTTYGGSSGLSNTDSVAITVNNVVIDSAFAKWQEAETAWVEKTKTGSTTHNIESLNQFSGIITATRDITSRDGSANQVDPAKRLTEYVDQVTGTDIVSVTEFNDGFTLTGKAAAGQAGAIKFWLDNDRTDGNNEMGVQLQHGQDGVSIDYDNATGEYTISFAAGSTALQQATHNTWGSGVHQITVDTDGNGAKNGSEASRLFLVASGTAHFTDTGLVSQNYSVQDRVTNDVFVYYHGDPDGAGIGLWTFLDNGDTASAGGVVANNKDLVRADLDYYNDPTFNSATPATASNTALHFVTDIVAQTWEFHMTSRTDMPTTWNVANAQAADHTLWGSNASRQASLAEVVALYAANFGGDGSERTPTTVGAVQIMSNARGISTIKYDNNGPDGWGTTMWTAAPTPSGHALMYLNNGSVNDSTLLFTANNVTAVL